MVKIFLSGIKTRGLKKYDLFLHAVLVGIALFSIGTVMKEVSESPFFGLIRALGGSFILLSFLMIIKENVDGRFFRFLVVVFVIIIITAIFRGLKINVDFLKHVVTSRELMLPYLLIAFLFAKVSISKLVIYFRYVILANVIFILIAFAFKDKVVAQGSFDFMEILNKFLAYSNGLMLLTINYFPRRIQFLVVFVFLMALYFAIVQARRNQIFTFSLFAVSTIILQVLQLKLSTLWRIVLGIVLFGIFAAIVYAIFLKYQDTVLERLVSRGLRDTRSFVEIEYWQDMDWFSVIFGKGISGTFYCPALYGQDTDADSMRIGIETGYLYYILKIGIVGFTLLIWISLSAFMKGFFNSKSNFIKGCAVYIIIALLEFYPAGNPLLTMRMMLFWVCVRLCTSKSILNLSDDDAIWKELKDNLLPKLRIKTINEGNE